MGKERKTFIAFFDLLGVKSIAEFNFKLYYEHINIFQSHLSELAKKYQGIEIYAFSDCAYLESKSIRELIQLLRELRRVLFVERIYFNAAVTVGSLKAKKHTQKQNDFTMFQSSDTVKVFSSQVSFTGIGILIDEEAKKEIDGDLRKQLIKSAYCVNFDPNGISTFKEFTDVKYLDTSVELLEYLIKKYLSTLTLNVKAARYYISAIITFIRQLDFSDLVDNYIKIMYAKQYRDQFISALLPIDLLFINAIYDGYDEKLEFITDLNIVNKVTDALDIVISKSYLTKGIVDLRLQSDSIISKTNKNLLSEYLFAY